MLNPDYIAKATEKAEAIAEAMHNSVIKQIVKGIMTRLGRGDDYILTPTDKYRIDALQDSGELLKDIRAELVKETPLLDEEVREAFKDAGIRSMHYDDKIYERADIDHGDYRQSPSTLRALQRNYEATEGALDNYTKTTALEARTAYVTEMNKAMMLVQSGAMGLNEATKQAIEDIAKTGISAIHYASGRVDTLEVAVARALRTGISQATAQMQLERMKELGCNLVITSSHLGARPTHEVWQGQIFHVDWDTMDITAQHTKDDPIPEPKTSSEKYLDFVTSTRYGYVDGLCGANCRHHFSPYFDGMTNPFPDYDSEENQKKYDEEQKQRAKEREIRQLKRERDAFKTAVDECQDESMKPTLENAYRGSKKRLADARAKYEEYSKSVNLKLREERIQVLTKSREFVKDTVEVKKVCDLPKDIYKVYPEVKNFVATLTKKMIVHIETDPAHPGSYTKYGDSLAEIISDPTYLLQDKDPTAIVILKELKDGDHVRAVLHTEETDGSTIRTAFHINEKTWKRYIKNSIVLYKKE